MVTATDQIATSASNLLAPAVNFQDFNPVILQEIVSKIQACCFDI
jgi:hypothetical protein